MQFFCCLVVVVESLAPAFRWYAQQLLLFSVLVASLADLRVGLPASCSGSFLLVSNSHLIFGGVYWFFVWHHQLVSEVLEDFLAGTFRAQVCDVLGAGNFA